MAEWVNTEHTHQNNLREQVGRGSQFSVIVQVAVAVVTPVETSYPLSQV